MLINVKKAYSNHVVNAYAVYLIISIDPGCITNSSFYVYVEFLKK